VDGGGVYVGREGVGNRSGRGIYVVSSGLRVSLGLECDLYDFVSRCDSRTEIGEYGVIWRENWDIPRDWINDETSPTPIATATETPPISESPVKLNNFS